MHNTQRYWDGAKWTDHIAPAATTAAPQAQQSADDPLTGLRWAAVLGALFMPFIGVICGIVLIAKGKIGPGVGSIVLSVFAFMFWYGVLISGDSSSYSGY